MFSDVIFFVSYIFIFRLSSYVYFQGFMSLGLGNLESFNPIFFLEKFLKSKMGKFLIQ